MCDSDLMCFLYEKSIICSKISQFSTEKRNKETCVFCLGWMDTNICSPAVFTAHPRTVYFCQNDSFSWIQAFAGHRNCQDTDTPHEQPAILLHWINHRLLGGDCNFTHSCSRQEISSFPFPFSPPSSWRCRCNTSSAGLCCHHLCP